MKKDVNIQKRTAIYAIIFVLLTCTILTVDIWTKYSLKPLEYIKYSMALTPQETSYLKSHVLQYGIDINDAPYAFVDEETGQNTGILVDYFNQMSVTLETGVQSVQNSKYYLAIKLKNDEIDAAVLNMTDVNKNVFLFTHPIYTERSRILVAGDSEFETISDIRDMSIAVVSGSAAHHAANKYFTEDKNVRLLLTNDMDASFYLLGMGEADAILGDEAKISYKLNNSIRTRRFKFVEGSVSEEDVAIAVNRDNDVMYSILNKTILEMQKTNQFSHIHSKWFGSFIPEIDEVSEKGITAGALVLILVLSFIFAIWNLTVKNQVNVKTRELKESRQELRDIIDSLKDGFLVTDSEGRIEVANRSLLNIIGMDFDDIIGRKIEEIGELGHFLQQVGSREPYLYNDRYYIVYHRPLNADSTDYLLFLEDYTDRHKQESLNRQEAKMIAVGELSAGLAHEIRNPLGLIKSYLFVLKRKVTEERRDHAIEVMDDSVDRINTLIENLLGFSRLTMEKSVRINLEDSVRQALSLEKKNLEKSGVSLNLTFTPPDCGEITINEDILKLALVNLINNSADALRDKEAEDKRIDIDFRLTKKKLTVKFRDNGEGIPRENLEAVFDPFFTTKETGTGLGLYILSQEITNAGGSISVDSRVGIYTEFTIVLPLGERDGSDEAGI